jgi:hypothetical protein
VQYTIYLIMGKPLELEDLTKEQRDWFMTYIWNGPGSRDYPIQPPELIFNIPSIRHDFEYFRGGTEEDRKETDKHFLDESLAIVKERPIYTRPFYFSISYIYYFGLVLLGSKAWEYYDKPAETWNEYLQHIVKYFGQLPTQPTGVTFARFLLGKRRSRIGKLKMIEIDFLHHNKHI